MTDYRGAGGGTGESQLGTLSIKTTKNRKKEEKSATRQVRKKNSHKQIVSVRKLGRYSLGFAAVEGSNEKAEIGKENCRLRSVFCLCLTMSLSVWTPKCRRRAISRRGPVPDAEM